MTEPSAAPFGGVITREMIALRLAQRAAPLARRAKTPAPPAAAPAPLSTSSPALPATSSAASPASAPPAPHLAPVPLDPRDEVVPQSPIRKRIARNLRQSLDNAAHTLVVVEVDYSAVEPLRQSRKLSYLPFVGRAVVDALALFPQVNASFDGESLTVHRAVNLGISVDLNFEGLVVPVIRDADTLRLESLAAAMREVAAAARARTLKADDLQGGTFTITNAGGYGTVVTAPIINPPQVAILSTDAVRMSPAAVPDGKGGWSLGIRPKGNLSLSFDHRAFDGAYAAAFVAHVRDTLSTRVWEDEL